MNPSGSGIHAPEHPPALKRRPHIVPASLVGRPTQRGCATIGVLPGEGIGPEIIGAALTVLEAVELVSSNMRFEVRTGGSIGDAAVRECGAAISSEVCEFCHNVFGAGGAILTGPGGGRFVYDLRRRFELSYKLNPLKSCAELSQVGRLKPEHAADVDVLIVRDNMEGIYQGRWEQTLDAQDGRIAHHSFHYSEGQVRHTLQVAAAVARERRGEVTVVVKSNGLPTISRLWSDCARSVGRDQAVKIRELDIDYAAYHLIQDPREFDVVVTSNLFGDVLSDVGGVLLGSRGLCFGASYSRGGAAVYQTNHGAAHNLAGTDRANPVGQIFALAMLLRESFGLDWQADLIEAAVADAWRDGHRTEDLRENGCRIVGTREMADCIAHAIVRRANTRAPG